MSKRTINLSALISITFSIVPVLASDSSYQNELEEIFQQNHGNKVYAEFFDERQAHFVKPINEQDLQNKAKEEEKAGSFDAATADYLRLARAALGQGDLDKMKPSLDKIALLAPKLSSTMKESLGKAMECVTANYKIRSQYNNSLAVEYFLTQTLAIKELAGSKDEELIPILLELAARKQTRMQARSAIDYYLRAVKFFEKSKTISDPQYLQCLAALQSLYKIEGSADESEAYFAKQKQYLEDLAKNEKGVKRLAYLLQLSSLYERSAKKEESNVLKDEVLADLEKVSQTADASQMREALALAEELKRGASFEVYGSGVPSERVERILKLAYKLKVASGQFDIWAAQDLGTLGNYLCKMGKANEAIALYKTALKYSANDSGISSTLNMNLMQALKKSGDAVATAQLEAEMKSAQDQELKKQEQAAEQALGLAREKSSVDPLSYANALLSVAVARARQGQIKPSLELARESMAVYKKLPGDKEGEYQNSLSEYVLMLIRLAKTKEDEHIIFEAADIIEKQQQDVRWDSYSRDVADYFSEKERYSDEANFLEYVLAIHRKYIPNKTNTLLSDYGLLKNAYSAAGQKAKAADLDKQISDLTRTKYGPSDPYFLQQKIDSAMADSQGGDSVKTEQTVNDLIKELEKKSSAEIKQEDRNKLAFLPSALYHFADILANGKHLSSADKIMSLSLSFARQNGNSDPTYDTFMKMTVKKIVDLHISKNEFAEAEALLLIEISYFEKRFGSDSEQALTQQLGLYEAYKQHAKHAEKMGNSQQAKQLVDKSEKVFETVLSAYIKNLGPNSQAVKELKERKAKGTPTADLQDGSFTAEQPKTYTALQPLALSVRHHLNDVPDQDMGSPREPLTFAIYGRSEVLLNGTSSTASYDSSKHPTAVLPDGGDIGSCGKIKFNDNAYTEGNILGRAIYYVQNNIKISSRVDASGSLVPDPTPLPAPLSPDPSLKEIIAKNENGSITQAQSGEIANLGDFILDEKETARIYPGDYIASSIQLKKSSKIVIDTSKDPAKKKFVRIFFTDAKSVPGKGPLVLSTDSELNKDGSPMQLQIWYPGSGLLLIDERATAHAVVYAPASLVSNSGVIYGSVVADEVRMEKNSQVVYDKKIDRQEIGLPKFTVHTVSPGHSAAEHSPGNLIMGSDPDAQILSNAILLFVSGEYERAIVALGEQLKNEQAAETYNIRACARIALGQYKQAIEDCDKAIVLDPNDVFPYTTRGEAYLRLGQNKEAEPDFKKALEMVPNPKEYAEMNSIALCWFGLGNTEKALGLLKKCIETDPSQSDAYTTRAFIYKKIGKANLEQSDLAAAAKARAESKKKFLP